MQNATIALSLNDLVAFDPRHALRDGERDCCCPLCGTEKRVDAAHRSLSYNAQTGLFRCARCGAKGILREWTKEKEPRSERYDPARTARARFAKRLALPPPTAPVQATPAPALQSPEQKHWREMLDRANLVSIAGTRGEKYLRNRRGLPTDVCDDAEVRFAASFFGRPAAVFPIRDTKGDLVAAQGRYVDEKDNPRMRTVGEKKHGVFWAASSGAELRAQPIERRWLTVTEAPIDALSLATCGVPGAIVALCGCDGVPTDLPLCVAFGMVYLGFDADEAGDKAAQLLAPLFSAMGATVLRLRPGGDVKDWNEALLCHGSSVLTSDLCTSLGIPEPPQEDEQEGNLAEEVYCLLPDEGQAGITADEIARQISGANITDVLHLLQTWRSESLVEVCEAENRVVGFYLRRDQVDTSDS